MYEIVLSEKAIVDILRLKKSEPAAFKKVGKLMEELKNIQLQVQVIRNH